MAGKIENLKNFTKGDPRINRKGRPKKLPHLDKLMAEVLGTDRENQRSEMEKIIAKLKRMAIKGNVRAAEILLERGYGKVTQKLLIDAHIEATEIVLPSGRKVQI